MSMRSRRAAPLICARIASRAASGISGRDRVMDPLVLGDRGFHDVLKRVAFARRDDGFAHLLREECQELDDVGVARGDGDASVEVEVGVDAALRPFLGAGHACKRRLDIGELRVVAPPRRQFGGVDLEDRAQFEQAFQIVGFGKRTGIDADRLVLFRPGDERPHPLAGIDHAVRAQARDRLANDIAAHVENAREFVFGWQPVAGLEAPAFDFPRDQRRDAQVERLIAVQLSECAGFRVSRQARPPVCRTCSPDS